MNQNVECSRKKVLITGAGGFVGSVLAEHVQTVQPCGELVLTDLRPPGYLEQLRPQVSFVPADLSDPEACRELISTEIATVFHCASLISGGAERDFVNGMKANVLGTMNLFEACRMRGHCPIVVFTSSIAVFGGKNLPSTVDDWTFLCPQTSYGTAKVIGEQLLNDYSRRGYIDGRGIRLPAVVIRDEPSPSADGITGAILREPLRGREYVCPLEPETRIPLLGIRDCVQILNELSRLPAEALGDHRIMNSPNITPSIEEMVSAVKKAECPNPGSVEFRPDETSGKTINAWPKKMKSSRAENLGLKATSTLNEIISDYLSRTLAENS